MARTYSPAIALADAGRGGGRTGRPPHRPAQRLTAAGSDGPRGTPAPTPADPARTVAFEVLRAVSSHNAYANLVLPALLRRRRLNDRDAAFGTELGYGTVRAQGSLDAIIGACLSQPLAELDPEVLDLLRLGAYELLRTRVPAHAAVSASVELARTTGNARVAGLTNAVLRKVAAHTWNDWSALLHPDDPLGAMAARYAHPRWIAEAFAAALGEHSNELEAALAADDTRPRTNLVARPGRMSTAQLLEQAGPDAVAGRYSPLSVELDGGDPAALPAVRDGRAGVQDEGSQLCALALAGADLAGPDERWLDLCAGPGGKAALLAGLAQQVGATLSANELHPHRAELVRQATEYWHVEVSVGDAAAVQAPGRGYDRVLVDAPCTGLGALRRRPEVRWRRTAADVEPLVELQTRLLRTAVELTRPGGIVAYVVCSPHLGETGDVVQAVLADGAVDQLDARPLFPGVPELNDGPAVQLWPHRHGTDAMYTAILRRR